MKRFIIDGHLDLSMNAIEWNRDLTQPLETIRAREANMKDRPDRGKGTVCLPELRKGNIGLVVATQLARVSPKGNPALSAWSSPQQAWAMTQAQLAWYKEMEAIGELTPIRNLEELDAHLTSWNSPETPGDKKPIGYILSLEGADSLVSISYLQRAYDYGLRAIGLSHFGPGRYAGGTKSLAGISPEGFDLLREIERLGMILDVTHLTDEAFDQALNTFN